MFYVMYGMNVLAAHMLEVGSTKIGDGASSRKGCVLNGQVTNTTHEYAPPSPRLLLPLSPLHLEYDGVFFKRAEADIEVHLDSPTYDLRGRTPKDNESKVKSQQSQAR